jgi:uncharacterized protein YkwD
MSHATRRPVRPVSALIGTFVAVAVTAGLAGPASAATSTSLAEKRTAVIKLTNKERAAKGCAPLKASNRLTTAAQRHANDMAAKDYFSHNSLDGRQWWQRIEALGYKNPAGENIAYGFDTASSVVKGWMNSPGHKRNILDCKFNKIGIGFTADGKYWVQDFGY